MRVRIGRQPYGTEMCRIRDHVLTNYSVVAKVMLSEANAAVNLFTISSTVDGSSLSLTLDNCARKLRVVNMGVGCRTAVAHDFSLPYQLANGTFYRLALEITEDKMAFFFECQEILPEFLHRSNCSLSTSCGIDMNTTIGVLGPANVDGCTTVRNE